MHMHMHMHMHKPVSVSRMIVPMWHCSLQTEQAGHRHAGVEGSSETISCCSRTQQNLLVPTYGDRSAQLQDQRHCIREPCEALDSRQCGLYTYVTYVSSITDMLYCM